LEAVAAFDPRFAAMVELAVRFGKTLLLLDVDGLDPFLYPLARRDLAKQGSRSVVVVGDKVMDWHDGFRLCLVTRNPAAELAPDAAALVVEVNFSVTRSGLEGQLLGVTIQHEQPALEAQKTEMLAQEEAFKVELAELESSLLAALADAEGDLLENTSLIESLTNTKVLAAQISASLALSAAASVELDEKRNQYRCFAKDGSQLFFLVAQLTAVNPMYRFSLHSFTGLFEKVWKSAVTLHATFLHLSMFFSFLYCFCAPSPRAPSCPSLSCSKP
jgi:dynein heavy chain 2